MPALANEENMTPAEKEAKIEKKADMWFSKIDTDGNGSITKAEHTAFGDKMFDETDTNDDGSISREELKAHKKKKEEEMKDK
jgi:Ca2+-binding EF-hand superfamily protein